MNDIQNTIYQNKWIRNIVESSTYTTALKLLARRIIPSSYRNEMKQTAKEAGVPYVSVLAINLSYELAIIALMVNKIPTLPEILKILGTAAREATPVGCTTVCILDNGSAEMWRNLDWADPDKALKKTIYLRQTQHSQDVAFAGMTSMLTAYRKGKTPYSVAINAVFTDIDPISMGAAPTMLLRKCIKTCATYDEAVDMLSKRALICPVVFTIMSHDGRMLAIERSPSRYAHRHPEPSKNGITRLVTANSLMLIPESKNASLGELGKNSCERYKCALESIDHGGLEDAPFTMKYAEFGCTIYTARIEFANQATPLTIR